MSTYCECSVCLHEFRDPRVLSCGHTYCLNCIIQITTNTNGLQCPLCRKYHTQYTTPQNVPRNVAMQQLLDEVRNSEKGMTLTTQQKLAKNVHPICEDCKKMCSVGCLQYCTQHATFVCTKCATKELRISFAKNRSILAIKHRRCITETALEHSSKVLQNEVAELNTLHDGFTRLSTTALAHLERRTNQLRSIVAQFDNERAEYSARVRRALIAIDARKAEYSSLANDPSQVATLVATGQLFKDSSDYDNPAYTALKSELDNAERRVNKYLS